MRTTLFLFLNAIFLILIAGNSPALVAQPTLQVVVDRMNVQPGDQLTARVLAKHFPPIRTHGIRIGYDQSLLQCLSVQNTGYYEGYSTFFFRQIDSVGGKAGADEAILGPGWVEKDGAVLEMRFVAIGAGRVYLPFAQTAVYDSGLASIRPIHIDSLLELGSLAAPRLLEPAPMQRDVALDVRFTWTAVDGATSYRVQVARDSAFSYGMEVDNTVAGQDIRTQLSEYNTDHFWRVRAEAPGISSSWSEVRGFTTEARALGTVRLLTPADAALLDGDVSIAFTWEPVDGAEVYDFEISESPGGTPLFLREVHGAAELIVSGLQLVQQKPYHWRVRARSAAGEGSWSMTRSFQLRPSPPQSIVLLLPAEGALVDPRKARLTWERDPNADLYFVQVATIADFSALVWESSVSGPEAQPPALETSTTYYWRVRGLNGAGVGPWSAVRSFLTDAQTSLGETPAAISGLWIGTPAPHPVSDVATLRIELSSAGAAVLDVFDLRGRIVARIAEAEFPEGENLLHWRVTGQGGQPLPAGTYLLRLRTAAGSVMRPVVVAAR